MSIKETDRKRNRYVKMLRFTYGDLDMADTHIADTVDYIDSKGGKIVSIPEPCVFGMKPALLIYSIVYEAEKRIEGLPVFRPVKKQVTIDEEEI